MAFNGTGTFVRLYNWVSDAAAGINITASRMDSETDGIATGLSNCITRDGQGKPTAAIDWNTQNLTNIGALAATTFTVTGNTGIGTAVPSYQLDVSKSGTAATDVVVMRVFANASATAGAQLIFGSVANGTQVASITGRTATATTGTLNFGVSALATVAQFDATGNFIPFATNTYTLGGSAARWSTVYGVLANFSGVVTASAGISTTGDNDGIGMPRSRTKAATTSRTATTTFADDPDLILPLAVGKYEVEAFLAVWGTTSGAGGFKLTPSFSGTSTSSAFGVSGFVLGSSWANSTLTQGVGGGPYSGNTTTVSSGPTPSDWMRITGTITVSVAGNLSLQWAQVASNANAANVGLGSFITATRTA